MLKQSSLDFGRRETVTRDVDNVVNTATDPVVSVMVTASAITSELLWPICQPKDISSV